MNRTTLAAATAAATLAAGGATAAAFDDELAAIKARLAALEKQVQVQNQVIAEKDRQIKALVDNPSVPAQSGDGGWFNKVEIGGVVEVEAGYASPYTGPATSDVVVATAEIGIAAQINDWTAAEISLLYEEDDTPIEVDVAIITIAPPDGDWFVTGGQQYVPFGSYETNLVSDPLTLEIGETRETALLAGIESNGFHANAYVFNGSNKKGGDDRIDNFGASAGYASEGDAGSFAVQVGWINDIGDSDGLQDAICTSLACGGTSTVADHVPGWTAAAMFESGPFVVIGEYTAATDDFAAAELPFGAGGASPSAFNVEAGYSFDLSGRPATVALGYQGTEEAFVAGVLELPKTRIAAAISVEVMDTTTLSFEWARDEDYGTADGGTGETANTATAQVAVEF